jgi:hypothetical protein
MELTEEQLQELKDTLRGIGAYLQEDKAHYVWNTFNHIRNEHEPRPCLCGSSGHHWKRAVDFLNDYVKDK